MAEGGGGASRGRPVLADLTRFRQPIPRPAAALAVPAGQEEAIFPGVVRSLGAASWAEALSDLSLLMKAFADGRAEGLGCTPAAASEDPSAPVAAAVLMPVVAGRDQRDPARLVLIRRAAGLRENPGDIAFPGGRLDPGEEPLTAALRECEEEIGLDRALVQVLGSLAPVYRASRAQAIVPFVGVVEAPPSLVPSPLEVEEILEVGLPALGDLSLYWEEEWMVPPSLALGQRRRRLHFFELGDELLWGASARIVVSFLDRLADAVATSG